MNDSTACRMIRAFACLARIEAMKAENEARKIQGDSPAYNADHFFSEAAALDELSHW